MKALFLLGADKPGVADDDLTAIRARVPDYAGLAEPLARRLSDQRLRTWAGELLAGLREGTALPDAVRERLDDAVLRCELGDQRLMLAFEQHGALERPAVRARLERADRALVEAVAAAQGADGPDALGRALDAMHAALDARLAAAVERERRLARKAAAGAGSRSSPAG